MPTRDEPKVIPAVVDRPNDSGVDLPPGRNAAELTPDDYHAEEIPEPPHHEPWEEETPERERAAVQRGDPGEAERRQAQPLGGVGPGPGSPR